MLEDVVEAGMRSKRSEKRSPHPDPSRERSSIR